jgi:hypothetical protein
MTVAVKKLRDLPVDRDTSRPFRLWDASEKKPVRWACFKNLRRAHMRALYEAAWSKGDTTFEVIDIRNGGLRGQYKRVGKHIEFWRSTHNVDREYIHG